MEKNCLSFSVYLSSSTTLSFFCFLFRLHVSKSLIQLSSSAKRGCRMIYIKTVINSDGPKSKVRTVKGVFACLCVSHLTLDLLLSGALLLLANRYDLLGVLRERESGRVRRHVVEGVSGWLKGTVYLQLFVEMVKKYAKVLSTVPKSKF